MLQRVMSDLTWMKNILAIDDEAHHCSPEKPKDADDERKGDERKERRKSNKAARLWISGLEAANRSSASPRLRVLVRVTAGRRNGSGTSRTVSGRSMLLSTPCCR